MYDEIGEIIYDLNIYIGFCGEYIGRFGKDGGKDNFEELLCGIREIISRLNILTTFIGIFLESLHGYI